MITIYTQQNCEACPKVIEELLRTFLDYKDSLGRHKLPLDREGDVDFHVREVSDLLAEADDRLRARITKAGGRMPVIRIGDAYFMPI